MTFRRLEDEIREILKNDQMARCDDMTLYANYAFGKLSKKGKSDRLWLVKVFSDYRFRIKHHIAKYDSVSRVRRKLQEREEDLRPNKELIKERKELERKYKAYAKGFKDNEII